MNPTFGLLFGKFLIDGMQIDPTIMGVVLGTTTCLYSIGSKWNFIFFHDDAWFQP
jgi:hypothetical protein